MSTYGSVPEVMAYVRRMKFDAARMPTTADVETWLSKRSAMLTGWLAAAGYAVPVTVAVSEEAKRVLDGFAVAGAVADAELSMASGGYDGDSEHDTREARFLSEFKAAEAYIAGDALAALRVPRTDASSTVALTFVNARYTASDDTDEYGRPSRFLGCS